MKLKCKLEAIEDISTNNVEYSYSVSSDNCAFAEILHNELSGLKEPLPKTEIIQTIKDIFNSNNYIVRSVVFLEWGNWLNDDELVHDFTCNIDF
jgi:hypothetical protein